MKLTPVQIQELYIFTRQHYVEHYDVQTELVDHLANDIEQIWQEEPNQSFEQARTISFKKFGVFGFMEVVTARQKVLGKKYWRLVWGIFKQFFSIPHILISGTIFIVFYFAFQVFPSKWLLISIGILSMIVIGTRLYFLNKEKKKRFKESNKKWLLEEYVFNLGSSIGFINLLLQIAINSRFTISNTTIVIASLILTSLFLLIYIITFILPSKIEEILENQYTEYKLV